MHIFEYCKVWDGKTNTRRRCNRWTGVSRDVPTHPAPIHLISEGFWPWFFIWHPWIWLHFYWRNNRQRGYPLELPFFLPRLYWSCKEEFLIEIVVQESLEFENSRKILLQFLNIFFGNGLVCRGNWNCSWENLRLYIILSFSIIVTLQSILLKVKKKKIGEEFFPLLNIF